MWGRARTSIHCWLALAASLLPAACLVKMPVPEGAVIHCETTAQCPDDMVCRVAINQCVEPDKKDDAAPDFVAAPMLSRTSGRQGSLFTLTSAVAFEAAVAAADERVLVVWQSADSDGTGIYGRQY